MNYAYEGRRVQWLYCLHGAKVHLYLFVQIHRQCICICVPGERKMFPFQNPSTVSSENNENKLIQMGPLFPNISFNFSQGSCVFFFSTVNQHLAALN